MPDQNFDNAMKSMGGGVPLSQHPNYLLDLNPQASNPLESLNKFEADVTATQQSFNLGTVNAASASDIDISGRYPTQFLGENNEANYYQQQGAGENLFNGLMTLGNSTLSKLEQGVGTIMGLQNSLIDYGVSGLLNAAGVAGQDDRFKNGIADVLAAAGDNVLTSWAKDQEENVNRIVRPKYRNPEMATKGPLYRARHDLSFWTEDGVDAAAFMIAAALTTKGIGAIGLGEGIVGELAVGAVEDAAATSEAFSGSLSTATRGVKAAEELNKLARVSKLIDNAALARKINQVSAAIVNTPIEAMSEATEVRHKVYDELKDDPRYAWMSDDEKKARAADAGMNTFGMNLAILSVSSMYEADLFLKKLPSTAGELAGRASLKGLVGEATFKVAAKDYILDAVKAAGKGIATEGFWEENMQLATQRFNEELAMTNKQKSGFFEGLAQQSKGALGKGLSQAGDTLGAIFGENKDIEASTSIFLGGLLGIGGGVMETGGQYLKNKEQARVTSEVYKKEVDAFKAIGNIYKTESYTKDDNTKGTRTVFDAQGKAIIDDEKLATQLADQSKILELTDIMHLNDSERKEFAKKLYEGELFTRFALSHFQAGLGKQLIDRLDKVANLSDEEIKMLGFDPKSKIGLNEKMAEYKAKAVKLQNLYDTIESNIIAPPNVVGYTPSKKAKKVSEYEQGLSEAQAAFYNRKAELFRLGARQFSLDDLTQHVDAQIAGLNAYLATNTPSNLKDTIVTDLNQKIANVKKAESHLEEMQLDSSAKQKLNEWYDVEGLKEAQLNVDKATKDLKDTEKLHEEDLKSMSKDVEGNYKYSADKERLSQTRDLKIAQLKKAEMVMSRNSVIERMSKLANPKTGQNFYNKYSARIVESKDPVMINKKVSTQQQTLEGYEIYEQKRMRGKRIQSKYTDILNEYTSELMMAGIDGATIADLVARVDEIRNLDAPLSKENKTKLVNRVTNDVNVAQDELKKQIDAIDAELSTLEIQPYIEEIGDYGFDQAAFDRHAILTESKAKLEDAQNALNDLVAKVNSIGEFIASDKTPDFIRRELAEEYFVDGEKITSDLKRSDQGYDSQDDLNHVQNEIKELESLKSIFEQREPLLKTKEFMGFMDKLTDALKQLREAEKEISRRLTDRNAKNEKVRINNANLYGHQLGIDFVNQTTTPIFKTVVNTINKVFAERAANILANIDKWTQEKDPKKKLGIVGGISDLYKLAYTSLTNEGKLEVDTELNKLKEDALKVIAENPVVKEILDVTPTLMKEYANNPGLIFIGGLLSRALTVHKNKYDVKKGTAFYKFREERDVLEYLENAKKDKRDGANYTTQEVVELIQAHINYLSLFDLSGDTSVNNLSYTGANKELEIQSKNKDGLTPSEQQLKSLRELTSFFYKDVKNDLYRAFAYLKGYAGTGKSSIVGKWLPARIGVKTSEIVAIGHNLSSSININEILGKNTEQYDDLIKALESDRKIRLVIIDEVGGFARTQLNIIAKKVQIRNEGKALDEQVKVVLMGDPNQLNIDSEGNLQNIPDTERVNLEGEEALANNTTYITPLTIRFRSNVSQISNFSDNFINQNKDLAAEEIIVKSNNPSLDPSITRKGEMTGVVGTKAFDADVVKVLSNTNTDDGKTRAIITNPGESVNKYRNLLNSNSIKNVEVLSYVDAQGRTIDEVYVNIDNTSTFENQKIYNKALYVATSRATNFILMGNMDIRNEEDSTILEQKNDVAQQLEDNKKEFTEAREIERDTIKGVVGDEQAKKADEQFEKESKKAKKEEKQEEEGEEVLEEEPGVEANLADIVEEAEAEGELPAEYTEEEEEAAVEAGILDKKELEEEENPSTLERIKTFSKTVIDTVGETAKQFVHNLAFPSFGATKNLVRGPNGMSLMSDRQFEKYIEAGHDGYKIVQHSVKENDAVYYAPMRDQNNFIMFVLLADEKNANGSVKEGFYRQVGVIGEQELKNMEGTTQDELFKKLTAVQNSTKPRVIEINLSKKNNIEIANLKPTTSDPGIASATGVIHNIAHLKFKYKGNDYSRFSFDETIKKFSEGYFGKKIDNEKLEHIKKLSYIQIFNAGELTKMNHAYNLVAGYPYLVLNGLEQVNVTSQGEVPAESKSMYIRLDRRKVHKDDHSLYLAPYFSFLKKAEQWDKMIGASKNKKKKEFLFGTPEGNNLVRKVVESKDAKEHLKSLGFKDIDDVKLTALARELKNLWRREPTTADLYPGTKVKATILIEDEPVEISGVVTKIIKPTDTRPLEAKVRYGEGKEERTITLPATDLIFTSEVPGKAQRVLDQLWNANISAIKKADMRKGRNVNNVQKAPSLLDVEGKTWNTQNLKDLMSFDKNGNHIFKINDKEISFRIPVPRFSNNKRIGANTINFKTKDRNSKNDKSVTNYFLQNNFDMVQQTVISVVHNKQTPVKPAKKPVVTPPPTAPTVTPKKSNIEERRKASLASIKPDPNVKGAYNAMMINYDDVTYNTAEGSKQELIEAINAKYDAESKTGSPWTATPNVSNLKLPGVVVSFESVDNGKSLITVNDKTVPLRDYDAAAFVTLITKFRLGRLTIKEFTTGVKDLFSKATSSTYSVTTTAAEEEINEAERSALELVEKNIRKKYKDETEEQIQERIKEKEVAIREQYAKKREKTAPKEEKADVTQEEATEKPPFEADIITAQDEVGETPSIQASAQEIEDEEAQERRERNARIKGRKGKQASKARYTAEDLGKRLTQDDVLKMVQQFFPRFTNANLKDKVKFVGEAEMMHLTMGEAAWGIFHKNTIYLLKNPDNTVYANVAKHEVFHMMYNNYLTKDERKKVQDIVLKEDPRTRFLNPDQLDEYIDEYMADLFMKTELPSGMNAFIKMIINKIKIFFNFVSPNIESLDDLFNVINSGYISLRFKSEDERIDDYIDTSINNSTIQLNC